jgi:hypothetical protein
MADERPTETVKRPEFVEFRNRIKRLVLRQRTESTCGACSLETTRSEYGRIVVAASLNVEGELTQHPDQLVPLLILQIRRVNAALSGSGNSIGEIGQCCLQGNRIDRRIGKVFCSRAVRRRRRRRLPRVSDYFPAALSRCPDGAPVPRRPVRGARENRRDCARGGRDRGELPVESALHRGGNPLGKLADLDELAFDAAEGLQNHVEDVHA